MATTPKQELHELIDGLDDDVARRLADAFRGARSPHSSGSPRPLSVADVLLAEPVMPADESADEMIATVRGWRREGGYA